MATKSKKKNALASERAIALTRLAYEVWNYHFYISNSNLQTNKYVLQILSNKQYASYKFSEQEVYNHYQRVHERMNLIHNRNAVTTWHSIADYEQDSKIKKTIRNYQVTENVK